MNKFTSTILIVITLTTAGCSKREAGPANAPATAQLQGQNDAEHKADEMLRQQSNRRSKPRK